MKDLVIRFYRGIASFWFFAVSIVFCVGFLAVGLYRFKFGGTLSGLPSDWSVFGSYVGGVLGPLVSFVTLLAVLKTVYLQRELLDSQREELERMSKLQADTFRAQEDQNKNIIEDAARNRVASFQGTLLRFIDQQVQILQRSVELKDAEDQRVASDVGAVWSARDRAKESMLKRERETLLIIDELSKLSAEVAMFEYGNVEEIRDLASLRLQRVLPWYSGLNK